MVTRNSGLKNTIIDKLDTLVRRYQDLEQEMTRPEVVSDYERLQALAKERASLEEVVTLYQEYRKAQVEMENTRAVMEEPDPELAALAREEMDRLEKRLEELETRLKTALLPKDAADEKDVVVEIRAGTGGEEAALFAADLFRMYSRYAAARGWSVDVMDSSPSDLGGSKRSSLR